MFKLPKHLLFFAVFASFAACATFGDRDEAQTRKTTKPPLKNSAWDGIFLAASYQKYIIPQLIEDLVKQEYGLRGALGYDFYSWGIALESGYSHITGLVSTVSGTTLPHPIVEEISIIPLNLMLSYRWRPFARSKSELLKGFQLRPEISGGVTRINVHNYKSVVGLLLSEGVLGDSWEASAGACLFVEWEFFKSVSLFGGGGLNAVFEIDGPVLLPVLQAGVRIKPVRITREIVHAIPKRLPKLTAPAAPIPEPVAVPKVTRSFNGKVMFLPNLAQFSDADAAQSLIGELGAIIMNYAGKLTIRAHAAPFYSSAEQLRVAQKRAAALTDYLGAKFGILFEDGEPVIECFDGSVAPEGKVENGVREDGTVISDWASYWASFRIVDFEYEYIE
jgi:hypothetical protein